jgi:hypothetical protein
MLPLMSFRVCSEHISMEQRYALKFVGLDLFGSQLNYYNLDYA